MVLGELYPALLSDGFGRSAVNIERETRRRQVEVLADKDFMAGVHEALASWLRGDKPPPWRDLKRKYAVGSVELP